MFVINFLSRDGSVMECIEIGTDFLEWLLASDFYKIGKSVTRNIAIEGEKETLSLVQLSKGNRKKFRDLLTEPIIEESDIVLDRLNDSLSKEEYEIVTYKLRKSQKLRKCIENEQYQYLLTH